MNKVNFKVGYEVEIQHFTFEQKNNSARNRLHIFQSRSSKTVCQYKTKLPVCEYYILMLIIPGYLGLYRFSIIVNTFGGKQSLVYQYAY